MRDQKGPECLKFYFGRGCKIWLNAHHQLCYGNPKETLSLLVIQCLKDHSAGFGLSIAGILILFHQPFRWPQINFGIWMMVSIFQSSLSVQVNTYINQCITISDFYHPKDCSLFPGWKNRCPAFCLLFIKYVNRPFIYRQILPMIYCFSGIFF